MVVLAGRSQGLLIDLNVRAAFLRVAATAGTNVHTTSGEDANPSCAKRLYPTFYFQVPDKRVRSMIKVG